MAIHRTYCALTLILLLTGSFAIPLRAEEEVAPAAETAGPADDSRPVTESPLTEADREHWAFRPVRRVTPPEVSDRAWSRHSIDRFILARIEQANLTPTGEADRSALLRRLTFDLTGLPPTPEDLEAFENNQAPDAWEQQVDRLLASPAYGERWSQHWLDLARFAETDGFEHDKVRSESWKFRDWVISALNHDLPFDLFIKEQIAGDLDSHAVATMFCLSGPDMPDLNDQVERRHLMLNEMTGVVGSVFLGLQFACAECHDHKYDPVSQNEFYRLRAVFESAVPNLKRDAPVATLAQQPDVIPARFWIRGNHRRPGPLVAPAFPRIASRSDAGDVPPPQKSPRSALASWLVRPDNPLTARVYVNRLWKTHFGRGLFDTPSDVGLLNAEPTHPELLDWLANDFSSNGWQIKRLHRQMVSSATYRQASHVGPRQVEWTRRLDVDPDNLLYSRSRRRRLDGESLRDAMLLMTGLLSDERGGPGVMPPLPEELVGTLLKGQWTVSPRLRDHDRRSIYIFARRNLRYPLFDIFDRPNADGSCAARNRSTTPTQSLHLLNSTFTLQIAQTLAGEVLRESHDSKKQIDNLYRRTFSRHATAAETERMIKFVEQESQRIAADRTNSELALPIGSDTSIDPAKGAAWVQACLAILNSSEMIYVD